MDTSPTVVTWRSILIGLFLLTLNVYWVTVTEMKYRAEATALPIFLYPVFILFCLVVSNYLLSKFWSSIQLLPSELLAIYAMLVVSFARDLPTKKTPVSTRRNIWMLG